MSKTRKALLALLPLLLLGCASFRAPAPDGFAPYANERTFRAVSADGVVYRVKTLKNDPKADLAFWQEAVKTRMEKAGYKIVSDSTLKLQGSEATLLELAAPFGDRDYSYLIALAISGKKILLVESAGDMRDFAPRKAAVLQAVRDIRFQ